jgi:hypothetical protein
MSDFILICGYFILMEDQSSFIVLIPITSKDAVDLASDFPFNIRCPSGVSSLASLSTFVEALSSFFVVFQLTLSP